jgi:hypothetical protein
LFGGVLIWFCYDYLETWLFAWMPHWRKPIAPDIVAKAAMFHMLYITCMVIGIRSRWGARVGRLFWKLPEPSRPANYFYVVVVAEIIGLAPYIIFTREPFYLSIWHGIFGGRTGLGTEWTVGRTGNVNYNYGAYVAQMLEIGTGGAILASFCAVFLNQGKVRNIFCFFFWLLQLGLGFGSGTRGEMVEIVLPVICFIFIRYHVIAQEMMKRYSLKAYAVVIGVLLVTVLLIQVQITYRNVGFGNVSLSEVSFRIEGNEMFSSSLMGFYYIPDRHDYFYNSFPGEQVILPIPNFILWAAIAPMPRALWTSKPIDPFWSWYNAVFTGRSTVAGGTTEGTTISEGIVGYWFFRNGIPGVIEGGLFMGWLMGLLERTLYNNNGRPFVFLSVMLLLTWLFRTYRGADLQDLAEVMVVIAGFSIFIVMLRPFVGGGRHPELE